MVIVEGIYVTLDQSPWNDIEWDELLFLDCPWHIARERLIRRHQQAGICDNGTEARIRVDFNDMLNANLVLETMRLGLDYISIQHEPLR